MFKYLAVLLFAVTVSAQTANVIQISSEDSVRAHELWNNLQKAQADWDAEQKVLEERYTLVKSGDPDAGNEGTTIGALGASGGLTLTIGCGYNVECQKESKEESRKREKDEKAWDDAHTRYYRKGFEGGFDLDKSFKFLVPKKSPEPGRITPYGGFNFTPLNLWGIK